MKQFDFLVVGGGIAGLTFALEAAKSGSVAVLFKRDVTESSTSWAQGGIAAVEADDDNVELHIEDTLKTGSGLSHPEIVRIVVTEGPERIHQLIERGTNFDKAANGKDYHLHQEGGHSRRRIFHAADATGYEIQRALLASAKANSNIQFFANCSAIDLLTSHKLKIDRKSENKVLGAYVLFQDGAIEPIVARKTLVATGGAGKVYLYTSNPDIASGDGIAMCFRAGVPVANMEFFQFHPTCLFHPKAKTFLITEAMRGEGALLKRINGERFMPRYDSRAELSPRDIVARAIDNEMKVHGEEYVLLDITHRPPDFVREHFPNIYKQCLEFGFDITKEPIPVVPAAHYCCGGVVADEYGATCLENLYVAGECAHSGLHGANRLASNSLLEGVVFGHRAAVNAANSLDRSKPLVLVPPWDVGSAVESEDAVVITQNWDEIRRFMWNYVGIVRSEKRLARAARRSELIHQEIQEYYWNFKVTSDLLELRNLSLVSYLIIKCATARKESRGLHYTLDHPKGDEKFCRDTVIVPTR